MRPIWKGSISFGLVYIPVAVYPATREEKLSFRQLRSTDLSPIRYKKVAEADAKEVAADQIVKGFEYERGRYVVLKDEDFEKVRIESSPNPFGPKRGRSSAIWSAVVCSIRFFTSISLMRVRRSGSDINERERCCRSGRRASTV